MTAETSAAEATGLGRVIREAIEIQKDFRGFVWYRVFRDNLTQMGVFFAVLNDSASTASSSRCSASDRFSAVEWVISATEFPAINRRLGHPTYVTMNDDLRHAHNDWLEIGTDLGLIALALVAVWWGATIWRASRITRGMSREQTLLGASAAIALVGVGVNAMFAYTTYNAAPPFVAAILAGILVAQRPPDRSWIVSIVAPSRWRFAAAAIVLL